MKRFFFPALATVALILIVYSAIFDGAKMKERKQYQEENSSITNGEQEMLQGAVYYNRLSSAEQHIYQNIKSAALELSQTTEKMSFVPTEKELEGALEALLLDEPSLFYLDPSGFSLEDIVYHETEIEDESVVEETRVVVQVEDKKYTTLQMAYIDDKENIEVMISRFNAALAKADLLTENLENEYDKALKLHDYLTDICKKSTDGKFKNTAYGGIVNGGANSYGYALSYKLLADRCGMISYVVSGNFNGADSYWNITLTDGKYYNIDVFGDDLDGIINNETLVGVRTHVYFCLSNSEFLKTHVPSNSQNLPECTDSTTYYKKYGLVCLNENTFKSDISDVLKKAKENKEMFFEIEVKLTDSTSDIENRINSLIKDVCPDYATSCSVYRVSNDYNVFTVHLIYDESAVETGQDTTVDTTE